MGGGHGRGEASRRGWRAGGARGRVEKGREAAAVPRGRRTFLFFSFSDRVEVEVLRQKR